MQLFSDVDGAFRGFCEACVTARAECPLSGNLTARELEETLYTAFDAFRQTPIPVWDAAVPGGGSLIDYSLIKSFVHGQLYYQTLWPGLATFLQAFLAGDVATVQATLVSNTSSAADAEAQSGIKCSDVRPGGQSDALADLMGVYRARRRISRFGGAVGDQFTARCAQWRLPARERYMGRFDGMPRGRVLLVSNTLDPGTPLAAAVNVSRTLGGSVLLEQRAVGVSALILPCVHVYRHM